ncbi:hypothetical protein YYG_01902 [Plasmodium vinckei petteri]|uniref:Fam-d protein n=1 Tax=Plasmodium vinckei petteri TaxID=138298 RepID=W7AHJ9_PLAVN|nr:hypothetical protein YYG_01902 [Plasmodium vinckei petteri]
MFSYTAHAATLQDANNSRPQSVGYVSVPQAFFKFHNYAKNNLEYLKIINCILRYEPDNTNYAYQGNNYHWVITDFDIFINNFVRNFNDQVFLNKLEAIKGTTHFVSYIKENIKYLATQHISKYDFEKNCDNNLNKLASDLKGLIYDKFGNDSKGKIYDEFVNDLKDFIYDKYINDIKDLICDRPGKNSKRGIKFFKGKNTNEGVPNTEKDFFKWIVDNSEINIRGYFIKIRKDGNYTDLCQNKSLYFNISISRNDANVTHDLKHPQPEVAELVSKPLKKTISLLP